MKSFLTVMALLILICKAYATDNIKVLILSDVYPNIPSKNEKMEQLGSINGTLLVMGTHYSGNIDVWKGEKGLYLINELPLEEYIKDVVAVEVSPDWDMEALKAQAVVSRTYAVFQKRMNGDSVYHIASSVLHQLYKGNNPDVRVSYAVQETNGEILAYNGQPIEAFYHSTCGGATENPEDVFGRAYPYLKSVESDCNISPFSVWERRIPLQEIEKAVKIPGIKEISIKSYTASKRVKQLVIKHSTGTMTINATDLRKALGWTRLPSTMFHIAQTGDSVLFEGSGYGHGVGLCQWCALRMAREGKNYKEILSYFYPGTVIQLYEGF